MEELEWQTYYKLLQKIASNQAIVGIVGVGYVGEALAKATSGAGFATVGFDIDNQKVDKINDENKKNLEATSDINKLKLCDAIAICLPTPLDQKKKPDLRVLKNVTLKLSKILKKGQLVVLESSVAPGTTRNIILPILKRSKLEISRDFFLGFSPERINPGNQKFNLKNTPKVVAGYDDYALKLTRTFYQKFVQDVVVASSLEVAEMTKVLENTFRLINISLINELASFTQKIGIDIWEVISAASTKPYGFMPHYPGPGVGGECIPVLPYYLLNESAKQKVKLNIVKAAAKVNELQPQKVAKAATNIINGRSNPKALIVGVAYKPEISDIRHSPALKIWKDLEDYGITVSYHDPYVPHFNGSKSANLTTRMLKEQDLIIITTNHKKINYIPLIKSNKPLLDTRNALSGNKHKNIIRI